MEPASFTIEAQVPEIYQLAVEQPEQVMAILPATAWEYGSYDARESVRLLYQPGFAESLLQWCLRFPSADSAEEIHQLFRFFSWRRHSEDAQIEWSRAPPGWVWPVSADILSWFHFGDICAPDPDIIKSKLEQDGWGWSDADSRCIYSLTRNLMLPEP